LKANTLILKIITLVFLSQSVLLWSQQDPNEIGFEEDKFQNYFYESLKFKGIENYDKAINELQKCLTIEPENHVVYFELGRNYYFLKDYKLAYDNFKKATQLEPNNRWYWASLYDVCYATRVFDQAIIILKKLIEFEPDYKNELLALYMTTQKHDDALQLISELNSSKGKSETREQYKAAIMNSTKYRGLEIENLLESIKKEPKTESNYIALIYLYSESNQSQKALEIAQKLEKQIPTSDWAQVSLFKFHLENKEEEAAVIAMYKVLKSSFIEVKIKHRDFNEFLIFTNSNPLFYSELEKAIKYLQTDSKVAVAKEVGKFFQNKKEWEKAITFYEIHEEFDPNDIENVLLLQEAYLQNNNTDKPLKSSSRNIDIYPLQPEFYYFSAVAYNNLKNHKKAAELLNTGLDFVIDNLILEAKFYTELSNSYNGLGDLTKKETFILKANMLLKQIKQ